MPDILDDTTDASDGDGGGGSGNDKTNVTVHIPTIIPTTTTTNTELNKQEINPDKILREVTIPIQFQNETDLPNKLPVMTVGKRRSWFGEVVIDDKMLRKMVRNFNQGVGLPGGINELHIDFEHKYYRSDAAGWVKGLSLNNGMLYFNNIDWTNVGSEAVLNKHYRFISLSFFHNYTKEFLEPSDKGYDNPDEIQEYGPTVVAAGLTNRPAVAQLPAVFSKDGGVRTNKSELEHDDVFRFDIKLKDLIDNKTNDDTKIINKDVNKTMSDKETDDDNKDNDKIESLQAKLNWYNKAFTKERINSLSKEAIDRGIAPAVINSFAALLGQVNIDDPQNITLNSDDKEVKVNMFEALSGLLLAMPKVSGIYDNKSGNDNDKSINTDDSDPIVLNDDAIEKAKKMAKEMGIEPDLENPYFKFAINKDN